MPTSPRKTSKRGFTLLEILLVVALIAILAVVLIPRVSTVLRVGVQSSVRRFAAMVKYTYDQSVMTGKVHRIHIDLDKQTWTVEATEIGKLPHQKAAEEFLPPGVSQFDLDEYDKDKKDKKQGDDADFSAIKGDIDVAVPKGVRIIAIDSWRLEKSENPATRGEVSIYAFPNGYIDDAIVYLGEMGKENQQQFKVSISSLTGRVGIETINDASDNKSRDTSSESSRARKPGGSR
ncbi:MAG TPA: type II secretion system protein [Bdellovibrionota bacterium]|jgi:prepilin-type N-terminal cleavage/methylation domain-containing protein|nr:type II secretion system protein [Bdellovibrionota bacterium]